VRLYRKAKTLALRSVRLINDQALSDIYYFTRFLRAVQGFPSPNDTVTR
jgi:hypothetical protein